MKNKKIIYALILPLVVVSGLVFANRDNKIEAAKKLTSKPPTAAEIKASREKWHASPDGINYDKWVASPAGKKVRNNQGKIMKHIIQFTNMEAVVTSVSLPEESRLGFGVMVKINNEDYILAFGPEEYDTNFLFFKHDFAQLHNLKVNDKIIIKSHTVSHAPKYAYPIVSGDYVEQNGKTLYKRAPRKGGC